MVKDVHLTYVRIIKCCKLMEDAKIVSCFREVKKMGMSAVQMHAKRDRNFWLMVVAKIVQAMKYRNKMERLVLCIPAVRIR